MRSQSGENVVRILPDGFGDNQRRIGINAFEDFETFALRINEPVSGDWIELMRADQLVAFRFERGGKGGFHLFLRGPADLIGGEAEVATGDELHLVFLQFERRDAFGLHGDSLDALSGWKFPSAGTG